MTSNEKKTLLEILQEKHSKMTKKQQILADYIVKNYESAAFLNTKEIARAANASESTLLRLVSALDFARFADFQDALQELVKSKMSSLELYKQEGNCSKKRLLDYVVGLETSVLNDMVRNIDENSFNLVIELLDTSRKVYIIGLGADEIYARYLFRFLSILRKDVVILAHETDPTIYTLLDETPLSSSVLIAFQFPRYHKKTYDICNVFVSRKIRFIAITDNVLAPLASLADILLQVPTRYITAIDPTGAVMVLVHALLTGVVMRSPNHYKKRLQLFYDLTEGFGNVLRSVSVPFNVDNIQ